MEYMGNNAMPSPTPTSMMLSESDFDARRHSIEQKLAKTVGNDIRSGECYNKLAMDKGNASILIKAYKHDSAIEDSTLTTGLLNPLRFAVKVNKPF
jgi:hypothetical protein